MALVDIEEGGENAGYYLTREWFNFLNTLDSVDQVLLVGYSLHGITFECYYGSIESYWIAGNYTTTFTDTEALFFNVLYNFGKVYNNAMQLYTYFNYPDLSTVDDYWGFGYNVGLIIADLFYPNEELIKDDGAGAELTDE